MPAAPAPPPMLDGGEWVINGAKQFITNSGTDITKLVTITAVTGRSEGGKPELSAILLPSGTPGFEVGQGVRQGRLERVGHASALLPGCARARGEPAR